MTVKTYPIERTEAQWRQMLTPEQFYVMRSHGTEAPGSCALLAEKRPGHFTCAGCGQKLFEVEAEVRERHRLAQFQRPVRGIRGDDCGP